MLDLTHHPRVELVMYLSQIDHLDHAMTQTMANRPRTEVKVGLFYLGFYLHSRSLRLCISSVRFLTQSYLYDFLHSRRLRLCISFVRFLLLSSVNISLPYISDMTLPILTKLGHKYPLITPLMSHDQIWVRGHVGVTGVKKVIFTKNANPLTDYVAWSHDLCMWYNLRPSTKVTLLDFDQRSFGVTGGKNKVKF